MINVWCDGSIKGWGSKGTKPLHGVGGYWAECTHDDGFYLEGTTDLGDKDPTLTNNVVEFKACHAALAELVARGETTHEVVVHSDSKLMVEQCSDRWKCNNQRLMGIRADIWALCEAFEQEVTFIWVPRERNQKADEISRSLYED